MSDSDTFDTIRVDRMEYFALSERASKAEALLSEQSAEHWREHMAQMSKATALERKMTLLRRDMDMAIDVAAFCIQLISAVQGDHSITHHQKELIFSLLVTDLRKIFPETVDDIPF